MISLVLCILALVAGYLIYGRFVEKVFGADPSNPTPAVTMSDGVDYVPMSKRKLFMIEFLNIAGTGPIFGAILGAKYGPSCYLWIVFGCIFGGAMHDYFSGMVSLRKNGAALPELIGQYLGKTTKNFMLVFTVLMLILVGAVFVYSPAVILGDMIGGENAEKTYLWSRVSIVVILIYYIIATLVPVDKIIGRIYPFFAFVLLFMAVSLLICLFITRPEGMPEIWSGLQNRNPGAGSIFPCLFISVACGAISGFHATQSTLAARCMTNEMQGRPVFYGSMITEGVVALIWAAISSYFFYAGGNVEMGAETVTSPPAVVTTVSRHWLGTVGSVLALLGVVAAPITSGDTALRSARMIVAEFANVEQKSLSKRLFVAVPIFIVTGILLWFNIKDAQNFDIIWRYFGWSNQTLAVFTLWATTVFLYKKKTGFYYFMALLPSAFMTSVCGTFILISKIGFNVPVAATPYLGVGIFFVSIVVFFLLVQRSRFSR